MTSLKKVATQTSSLVCKLDVASANEKPLPFTGIVSLAFSSTEATTAPLELDLANTANPVSYTAFYQLNSSCKGCGRAPSARLSGGVTLMSTN